MMRINYPPNSRTRAAFTLVEMLVSVTLVLIIMSMFAAIFSVATDTVKMQRGLAANDQKARALVTLIRNDFAKRTQRYPLPFYPTEDEATSPTPFAGRTGYIYISCNDPVSAHDDLVQFTVDARNLNEATNQTQYFGAAALLMDPAEVAATSLVASPNQPEADDRDIRENSIAASNAAEVTIFMRNNKLWRRTVLLRDPVSSPGDPQPQTADGVRFFANQPVVGSFGAPPAPATGGWFARAGVGVADNDFWRHFDFAAVPAGGSIPPTNLEFVSVDDLNNQLAGGGLRALGAPFNRFGFNAEVGPLRGLSREHDGVLTQRFLGRWLHAETSHDNFNYPLAASIMATTSGNPMDVVNSPTGLPPGEDVVTDFVGANGRGGERRMEDLLLSDVESFRVEIWDRRLGQYVVPGYGSPTDADAAVGDYHIRRNLQYDGTWFRYGPLIDDLDGSTPRQDGVVPRVFDTWHPNILDLNNDSIVDLAETQSPFLAYRFYPPRQNEDSSTAVTPAIGEKGPSSPLAPMETISIEVPPNSGSFQTRGVEYWNENVEYEIGDVVFARDNIGVNGWDADSSGSFDWIDDAGTVPNQGAHIAYRCVRAGTSAATPPGWPTTPGRVISDGTDVRWIAFDNRLPLTSVRMTIRFRDVPSDQIKQLTLILPLTDE